MMKKIIFSILAVSTLVHAGFWGSMAGGAIGASLAGGSKTIIYKPGSAESRMNKVNEYLWNMHKTGKYTKDYKFYLKYLEKSDDITNLDTVAWVYKDNGNKKKAIEIYKTRIMPWVKIEKPKIQEKYKIYFKKISDQIVSSPKPKKTSKQKCIEKGGNWSWDGSINKWSCN
jgi:hypothetical protein